MVHGQITAIPADQHELLSKQWLKNWTDKLRGLDELPSFDSTIKATLDANKKKYGMLGR